MPYSWQTQEQKAFFDEYLTLYCRTYDEGKLKELFWLSVTLEWFKRWPLSKPPAELIAKAGTVEKAWKVWKSRKIEVSIAQWHLLRLELTL